MNNRTFWRYYRHEMPGLLKQARQTLTWFFLSHFGVRRHSQQLFAPWKRLFISQSKTQPTSAWHIFSFNLISRFIGSIVRMVTILTGLTLAGASQVVFVCLTVCWYVFFPISFIIFIFESKLHSNFDTSTLANSTHCLHFLQSQPVIQEVFERADWNTTQIEQCYACLESSNPLFSSQQLTAINNRFPAQSALIALDTLILSEPIRTSLIQQSLDVDLLHDCISWVKIRYQEQGHKYHWYEKEAWTHSTVIGVDWAYGFTPTLDQFSQNLNEVALKKTQSNTRPTELQHLTEVFVSRQNTALLLVGEPGVGKKSLCLSLAQAIVDHEVPHALADHRVMLLNMAAILAEVARPAEQVWTLSHIFAEASAAGNCIVVIEHLDKYISNRWGEADFSTLFSQLGKEYRLKLIGLVTTSGFRTTITQNSLVMAGFDIRHLYPLNLTETLEVLEEAVYRFESDSLLITLPALQEIVKRSQQLLDHLPNPEKSLTLLDTVIGGVSTNQPRLTKQIVLDVLSAKLGIPIGGVNNLERVKLQSLENELSKRVIGQKRAIHALTASVKRAALQLQTQEKPKGTFLFLGPTGVGKTETAKALADIYFGSRDRLIRFDFGEYSTAASLSNLIGSSVGQMDHQSGGLLTEAIRQNPYSVVLLDELEKAHPTILTALLTVLDEGYLTDSRGQKISFRHTFIIATSNAASQLLYTKDQKSTLPISELSDKEYQELHTKVVNHLLETHSFAPEFLNRFDGIVLFSALTPETLKLIVAEKLKNVTDTLFKEHQIQVVIGQQTWDIILQNSYDPTFGARNLERVILEQVIDVVADQMLNNPMEPGSTLTLA